jgi:hypothetical protein
MLLRQMLLRGVECGLVSGVAEHFRLGLDATDIYSRSSGKGGEHPTISNVLSIGSIG